MSAIPENLIESELFGFEKGAFTDAIKEKPGLFELAEGGTLFLDEIAEMPYHLQAKLLRVLQEREFYRLGSTKPKKLNVRIISATNQNVDEMIKNNKFREDLFYRLNTIPIKIPPLRERKNDILPIAENILNNVVKEYNLEKKEFSEEAKQKLLEYDWPGNIRELINVVQRAAILSEGNVITKDDIYF
jgi:two-component system NtrC family response regulator